MIRQTISVLFIFGLALGSVRAENPGQQPGVPLTLNDLLQHMQPEPPSPDTKLLSLEECLKEAIEGNYAVKIARNEQEIARNNHTPAPFLPVLSAGLDQSQDRLSNRDVYRGGEPAVKQDYVANTYTADLSLDWRLFDGMSMFATYDTQKELLKAGELNLRGNIESLVSDISEQYYYIVTEQNRLEAAKLYLAISTLRYNQALEKYNIGSISGLEMKQAKIDLNADSSKLVLQQEIIRNAYITLYEMMNVDLKTKAQLCDTITPNGQLSLEVLRTEAMDRNTSVLLARSGQRVSELDLKIARSSRYPTLDFTAAYRFDHNASGKLAPRFSQLHGATWGFTASIKLFDRLETNRKIKNAKLELDNSELTLQQTQLGVTSEISRLFNTYRKNFMMIGFEQESADAALANLDAAMEMYRLGTMSGIEFREIQRSYLEAVERKLDAVYQARISEINLRYLSGGILQ